MANSVTVNNYITREKIDISNAVILDIESLSDSAEFNTKSIYQVGNIVFVSIGLKNAVLSTANTWRKFLLINNSLYRPSSNTLLTASYGDTEFLGCILGSNGKIYLKTASTFSGRYLNIFGSYPVN